MKKLSILVLFLVIVASNNLLCVMPWQTHRGRLFAVLKETQSAYLIVSSKLDAIKKSTQIKKVIIKVGMIILAVGYTACFITPNQNMHSVLSYNNLFVY